MTTSNMIEPNTVEEEVTDLSEYNETLLLRILSGESITDGINKYDKEDLDVHLFEKLDECGFSDLLLEEFDVNSFTSRVEEEALNWVESFSKEVGEWELANDVPFNY